MSMFYRLGEVAALRALGFEKIALESWESGFNIPVPGARKAPPPPGVPRNMDAFNAMRARQAAKASAPAAQAAQTVAQEVAHAAPAATAAATEAATEAPGLLRRMMSGVGNTKVPLKALGGLGMLAGGAYLAHKATANPQVEVHPTLPMRTMYS